MNTFWADAAAAKPTTAHTATLFILAAPNRVAFQPLNAAEFSVILHRINRAQIAARNAREISEYFCQEVDMDFDRMRNLSGHSS
jgi:hypothetical protein